MRVERRIRGGKVGPVKSRYVRREVPLAVAMARALWRVRATVADGSPVFPAADGGPLDRGQPFRVVKVAARAWGVACAGLHTLRHTCATLAFRSGWNAKQVQMLLGHSPAFTLAMYVHLLPDDLPEPVFLDETAASLVRAYAAEELRRASPAAAVE